MKRFGLLVAVVASVALWTNVSMAEDAEKAASKELKTVAGKSACATCEGVTADAHQIMLVDKAGTRWVLVGDSKSYKEAHKVRDQGKTMTATVAGKPEIKKDSDGKEYKVVKVSEVKVNEA